MKYPWSRVFAKQRSTRGQTKNATNNQFTRVTTFTENSLEMTLGPKLMTKPSLTLGEEQFGTEAEERLAVG